MDTPLVDREGFPRADIDVAGVRTARVQVIRLRNDLKAAQKAVSGRLHGWMRLHRALQPMLQCVELTCHS